MADTDNPICSFNLHMADTDNPICSFICIWQTQIIQFVHLFAYGRHRSSNLFIYLHMTDLNLFNYLSVITFHKLIVTENGFSTLLFFVAESQKNMTTKIVQVTEVKGTDIFCKKDQLVLDFHNAKKLIIDGTYEATLKKRIHEFANGLPMWKWFPGEMYLSGGGFNLILDTELNVTDDKFATSDIDLFFLGTESRKKEMFKEFMCDLQNKCGDRPIYMGVNRSVVNIWVSGYSRMIQVILMNDKTHQCISDVLDGFDFDHLRAAYDGKDIVLHKEAYDAITTRSTRYTGSTGDEDKIIQRMMKALMRDYNFTVEEQGVKMSQIFSSYDTNKVPKCSPSEEDDDDTICNLLKKDYNCLHVFRYTSVPHKLVKFGGLDNTAYGYHHKIEIELGNPTKPPKLPSLSLLKAHAGIKDNFLTGVRFKINTSKLKADIYGNLYAHLSPAEFKLICDLLLMMNGVCPSSSYVMPIKIAPQLDDSKITQILKKPFMYLNLKMATKMTTFVFFA